jgi:predicted DCC family thiol-disulfide oxidoreductase YuxK
LEYDQNVTESPDISKPIVLFDGSCGFCDAMVRFVIHRDSRKRFRFAPLESQTGKQLTAKHGIHPELTDSVVLVDGDKAYTKSTAALLIAVELDTPWPLAGLLGHLPLHLRDAAYDWVARHRKQWFKSDQCPIPTAEERERFVEPPPAVSR